MDATIEDGNRVSVQIELAYFTARDDDTTTVKRRQLLQESTGSHAQSSLLTIFGTSSTVVSTTTVDVTQARLNLVAASLGALQQATSVASSEVSSELAGANDTVAVGALLDN